MNALRKLSTGERVIVALAALVIVLAAIEIVIAAAGLVKLWAFIAACWAFNTIVCNFSIAYLRRTQGGGQS